MEPAGIAPAAGFNVSVSSTISGAGGLPLLLSPPSSALLGVISPSNTISATGLKPDRYCKGTLMKV